MNEWIKLIVELLTVLAAMIPLVYKLIEYVQKAIKEKNWTALLEMVNTYIIEAEQKFDNGADRKEWVIALVKASADSINYDINEKELSDLIDSIVAVTNMVNINKQVIDD